LSCTGLQILQKVTSRGKPGNGRQPHPALERCRRPGGQTTVGNIRQEHSPGGGKQAQPPKDKISARAQQPGPIWAEPAGSADKRQ
jgi:hypothetical protein